MLESLAEYLAYALFVVFLFGCLNYVMSSVETERAVDAERRNPEQPQEDSHPILAPGSRF